MTSSLALPRAVVPGIAGPAAFGLLPGAWQVPAPRSFYDALAPFAGEEPGR
jgi:hypothetical protein